MAWPGRRIEYWQCDCSEEHTTEFVKLILSDGADAFLPLMELVRNSTLAPKWAFEAFLAEYGSPHEQEVPYLRFVLGTHFSIQAQAVSCLEHLCKHGVLSEEQKELFLAVCRQQVL